MNRIAIRINGKHFLTEGGKPSKDRTQAKRFPDESSAEKAIDREMETTHKQRSAYEIVVLMTRRH